MIEVKNLSKIYPNSQTRMKALDDVSFTLPDTGLIFIVGKSGSGKSTLINMIGTLDDATSGSILIDGKDVLQMKAGELDRYRSQYLGIIYQNYNLFENETVVDNIKISLQLNDTNETPEESNARIDALLDSVDLASQKDKIVKNMSGGQKQRVAIARALIKNPRLILADEPTGNLDSKTTDIIFSLLKEISKDKLIVVISHDNKSAQKYADRILEISDGKIFTDKVRNEQYQQQKEKYTTKTKIYSDRKLQASELVKINTRLLDTDFRVVNTEDKFIPVNEKEIVSTNAGMKLEKNKKFKNAVISTLSTFLKNSKSSLFGTILLAIFVISILSLSLCFAKFDGRTAISDVASRYPYIGIVLKKGYSNTNNLNNVEKHYLVKTTDEDTEKLKAVYDGKYYPVYSVPVFGSGNSLFVGTSIEDGNFSGLYANSAVGVVTVDREYLSSVYGEIKVLAGSLVDAENSMGLILTDYLADSFLACNPGLVSKDPTDPYQNLLNPEMMAENGQNNYLVIAVIETGYEERYQAVIDGYNDASRHSSRASEIISEITSSGLFTAFHDEYHSSLGLAYSLNPDYIADYTENMSYAVFRNALLYYGDDFNNPAAVYTSGTCVLDEELKENEILVSDNVYAGLKKLQSDETEVKNSAQEETFTVMIANYGFDQMTKDEPLSMKELKVVGSRADLDDTGIAASSEYLSVLKGDQVFSFGYLIENKDYAIDVHDALKTDFFYSDSYVYNSLYTLMNITAIFSSVFLIVVIFLVVILTIVVLTHNLRIVKQERYRIGIYKALGCSDGILYLAMFLYSLITVVVIFAASIFFTMGLSLLADAILRYSFCKFLNNYLYNEIGLLRFHFLYVLIFNGIVFLFTLISSFIPFAKIKRIKPNEILRKVDD